ncbi:MAG: hypothetical protein K6B52_06120 [Clostridiales bacterium]|nr:hypothetical protein [Clostridiales bacterium]
MSRLKKIAVIAIAVMVAFALISSVSFVAAESDHECTGENCEICCSITACINNIRTLTAAFTATVTVAVLLSGICSSVTICTVFSGIKSPVLLKVRLLN